MCMMTEQDKEWRKRYKAAALSCLFSGVPAPEQAPFIAEAAGMIADALIAEDKEHDNG